MESSIRRYVEALFSKTPQSREATDLREELILNLIEKYHAEQVEGKSDKDAYADTIAGIGDVDELLASVGGTSPFVSPEAPTSPVMSSPKKRSGVATALHIIGIVLSVLVGIALIFGILAAVFFGGNIGRYIEVATGENYNSAVRSDGTYDFSEDIRRIDLQWVSGNVTVRTWDGDTIRLVETSHNLITDRTALRYRVSGDTLSVRFYRGGLFTMFSLYNVDKTILVYLPQALADNIDALDIQTVSAPVTVDGLAASQLTVESVSGEIDANGTFSVCDLQTVSGKICLIDQGDETQVKAKTVSGDLELTGNLQTLESDTTSGRANVHSTLCPDDMSFDTISGDLELTLPAACGFTVHMDTVSGEFESEFAVIKFETLYYSGDGNTSISVDSVSGNLKIVPEGA